MKAHDTRFQLQGFSYKADKQEGGFHYEGWREKASEERWSLWYHVEIKNENEEDSYFNLSYTTGSFSIRNCYKRTFQSFELSNKKLDLAD